MKEYEDRAVSLALNRPKLQALTDKLKAVRMTCPLFDTNRWVSSKYYFIRSNFCVLYGKLSLSFTLIISQVRNLDRAYFKMWNLHCSGQRPQHFKVTENDMECPYDK
jgi:protein O-GlcNAc transferase